MKQISRLTRKHRNIPIYIIIGVMFSTFIVYNFYDTIILQSFARIGSVTDSAPISILPHNVYEYQYNLLTQPKCKKPKYDIVYLVKSALKNYDKRIAIRITWGREKNYKVRTLFVVGLDNENNHDKIMTEFETFGDVIFSDFQDTYSNLSLKCILAINWAREFCPNSRSYVLVDDDSYVSTKNLLSYLNNEENFDPKYRFTNVFLNSTGVESKLKKPRLIGGELMMSRPVQRLGKYAVSSQEFPEVRYPSYIDGHIVVMSRDVLDELHEAAHHVKFIRLDDIYMSFLAMQAGLKLTNIPGITREAISFIDFWGLRWFGLRHFDSIISSHYVSSDDELITIYNFQSKRGNV